MVPEMQGLATNVTILDGHLIPLQHAWESGLEVFRQAQPRGARRYQEPPPRIRSFVSILCAFEVRPWWGKKVGIEWEWELREWNEWEWELDGNGIWSGME